MVSARLKFLDSTDRRSSRRKAIDRLSTLRDGGAGATPLDVTITDLSVDGCRVMTSVEMAIGTPVSIGLAGGGVAIGSIVRRDGDGYGCAFDPILTRNQLMKAFAGDSPLATLAISPWDQPPSATAAARAADEKWPASVRLGLAIGLPAASWAALIGLVVALTR